MSGDAVLDDVRVEVAVNGGLMRGLAANARMLDVGGRYVRDAETEPRYRLWSKDNQYPVMILALDGTGRSIAVEIWSLSPTGLVSLFLGEPEGLSLGKVRLEDGSVVLGVIGEPSEVQGEREITAYGGWRTYVQAEGIAG